MSDKKQAVVTGANKGIGFEIARQLLGQGFVVWIGARDPERGEAAAKLLRDEGGDARFLRLDVTSDESVAQAVQAVGAQTNRVDVLVNNAGIAVGSRTIPSETSIEDFIATYDVNVFGVFRVTKAFLPLLRAAPAARIVMMSSDLGSLAKRLDPTEPTYPVNVGAYNSSKSALNGLTIALAKELADTGIKVNAANPGYTATDLNDNQGPKSPQDAARVAIYLATLPDDGPTAGFFNDTGREPW